MNKLFTVLNSAEFISLFTWCDSEIRLVMGYINIAALTALTDMNSCSNQKYWGLSTKAFNKSGYEYRVA